MLLLPFLFSNIQTYNADLNKLSGFKDARGNDVLYSYDNAGNLTSIIYEDGTTDKYVYNADGLLVFDRNNDGYINDNSELFGNFTTSGFVELRAIDSNSDGFITAADNNFSDLQIWRDLDTDGRSDVNELYSLDELDITRISAVADNVYILNAGNEIKETTFYELGDGTTREIVDAWFTIDQLNSYYDHNSTYSEPIVITEEILNLPNLRGYGNLPDLRIAMAKDAELVDLVQSFSDTVTSGDVAGGRDLVAPILYRWAGVDDADPATRGKVDAQKLRFLEKFIGRNWRNSSDDNLANPGGVAQFAAVNNTFDNLFPELEIRLLVQAADSPVNYNIVTESYVFDLGLTEALEQLTEILAQAETAPSETLDLQAIALTQFIRQQGGEYENWLVGKISDDKFVGNEANEFILGFSGSDSLKGNAGNDTLNGGAGNDTLEGGTGNDLYLGSTGNDLLADDNYGLLGQDTLEGGTGNDTLRGMADDDLYLFNKGYGHDVIEDYKLVKYYYSSAKENGGDNDTLRFGNGITRNNLTWNFDGKDLTFNLTDSPDDSLTILNYADANFRIENIEVAGTQLAIEEILNSKINEDSTGSNSLRWNQTSIAFRGLDGNDTITTGNYDDKIWGGAGNDQLNSGFGNDTLYGGLGNDTLYGGEGIDWLVEYGDVDYVLTDTTLTGRGSDRFNQIELARLQGGAGDNKIDASAVTQLNVTLDGATAGGNDTLIGGAKDDFLIGRNGNDYLKGGDGNDDLFGSDGNDYLSGGNGDDYFNGGSGNDTLYGGLGNDTLYGHDGIDWLLEFGDVDYVLTDNSLTGRGSDRFN